MKYEIPIEAITNAMVNAVTHRDYASNGSVQVMLFRDRSRGVESLLVAFRFIAGKIKTTSFLFAP